MATDPCTATVRGVADFPQVNVRSGPGTNTDIQASLDVGTGGLKVLEARPDAQGKEAQGKVYQWLRLALPDGSEGWVRDDLLEIQGDCAAHGYGQLASPVRAFSLTRGASALPTETQERIRKAAFNITSGFEGGAYSSYQTYDSGLVSFGRFQFTLASGSLFLVLDRYLKARPTGPLSDELRTAYYQRVKDRDGALRQDARLRELLREAAQDDAMRQAQDEVATDVYWRRIQSISVQPRNLQTPLGQALLFDTGINHGVFHNMIGLAEKKLNVAPRSRVGENGTTETILITEVAKIRQERLARLAERLRLPGLKRRGDFWANLVKSGDWKLEGDLHGELETSLGLRVQVRDP